VDSSKSKKILLKIDGPVKQASGEDKKLPPWLFQHRTLTDALENAKPVKKETLINTLNHIHFIDEYVFALLGHPKYKESVLIRAYPEPCLGSKLTCRWTDDNPAGLKPEEYKFQYVIIIDGRSLILVPAAVQEIDNKHFTIELPSLSHAVGQRQARRYPCQNVTVELIQSGFLAKGHLVDFSPVGFSIKVRPEAPSSFQWLNLDGLVTVHFRNEQQILFSGVCECIRQRGKFQEREIVLSPLDEEISRFKKSKVRNPRQKLLPAPVLLFNHPLLKKRVQIEVSDISTSGLSVYEKANEGVLMPGMIIPNLTINFAGALAIECYAQVIYRVKEDEQSVRIGLAVLDMDIDMYSKLTHILSNAIDPHFYSSKDVDMDALWEFFFESGFLYPTKYRLIQSYRENFKETYKKLYQECPEIARYFTYQRNGQIYGHIAAVRAYERAWLIQHHSSRAMDNKRAGFLVLKQLNHYMNDIHRLPSAKMQYLMTYFQPENKIPDRIFGGFTKMLENTKGSSLDLFSYLPYTRLSVGARLPEGWSLRECSASDLWELNQSYGHYSGGLLLDALGLDQEVSDDQSLEETYTRYGYLRKLKAYSLVNRSTLNAVLISEKSDMGLNLSELLNGIKVLVTEPDKMPWNVLSIAISQLAADYPMDRVPILFYPFEYVKIKNVPYEKQYQFFIMNVRYLNDYMEYMQRKFRIRI
jgi:hypothetical protein